VKVLGIVQEQHPDRARLFMQWHGMSWPLMVDSLNLLAVWAVPMTVAIDEHGIVRAINPSLADIDGLRERFLEADFLPPKSMPDASPLPAPDSAPPASDAPAPEWRNYGDALVLWGGVNAIDDAIDAYRRALDLEPEDAVTRFRLGVAYRSRHDGPLRMPEDFRYAVEQWSSALARQPNQYIWRRRIQQYGPRLDKPYPFYDWVAEARRDIRSRGQVPVPLPVEPAGAEIASPARELAELHAGESAPDPEGLVWRDSDGFVRIAATPVPPRVPPGAATRVHLLLSPDLVRDIHWNNEAGDHVLWLEPPPGWSTPNRRLVLPSALAAVSEEDRIIDFELRSPADAVGTVALKGYALYYICEGARGMCLFRRQDFELPLSLDPGAPVLGTP
jgi:hypothetical protein